MKGKEEKKTNQSFYGVLGEKGQLVIDQSLSTTVENSTEFNGDKNLIELNKHSTNLKTRINKLNNLEKTK